MINYYTYIHRKADTNEIFYVGKGKERRAWSTSKRNAHWHNIVQKHGVTVEIVANWRSSKEALDHEVFLIWCLRDMGIALCNMTRGGDGLCDPTQEVRDKIAESLRGRPGRPMGESTKKIMSESRKGIGNPMFGRKITEEAKKKRLQTLMASGYKPSPETGKKISDALINGYHPMRGKTGKSHYGSKPVMCIDAAIAFDSIGDAVRWLKANGKPNARDWNICAACNGKRKTAYGMLWQYHINEERSAA
jgi:hypothetical protein